MPHTNLYGPVNSLGFGMHFQNWAYSTAEAGWDHGDFSFGIFPRPGSQKPYFQEPRRQEAWDMCKGTENFYPNAPSISLWHANQVHDFAGSYRAIYTVWEGSEPPPAYIRGMRKVDHVIVPTQWHAMQLLQLEFEPEKVSVIPEGYDSRVFNQDPPSGYDHWVDGLLEGRETFLNIGKMEKRKGIDCTLSVMTKIATERHEELGEDIAFILHWANPFIKDWQQILDKMLKAHGWYFAGVDDEKGMYVDYRHENWKEEDSDDDPVIIRCITGRLDTPYQVAGLYHAATWLFHPAYAEGWGLPILEAMACETPVLCQPVSGMTEYLKVGAFIPLTGADVIAEDGLWFHGDQGTWSVTDRVHAADTVIACTNFEDGYQELMNAGSELAKSWTFDKAGIKSIPVLELMHERNDVRSHVTA